jgi:hypothetical protein
VITTPDILIAAEDLGFGGGSPLSYLRETTDNWINNDGRNGNTATAGPGTIQGPVQITFSTIGEVTQLIYPLFDDISETLLEFRYGTFDGSGSPVVIFPNGTSVQQVEDGISTNSVPSTP